MALSEERALLDALVFALTGDAVQTLSHVGASFRERRLRHREGARWLVVTDLPVDARARRTRRWRGWRGWRVRGWLTDGERAVAVLEATATKR